MASHRRGTMRDMTDANGFGRQDFAPAYQVEPDPELPADGAWSCPVFAFDREGRVRTEFVSRWGAPRIVRVRPGASPEWVGMFPSGGLGGVSGVFATPSPQRVCVLVDGAAYMVRVDAPQDGADVAHDQVVQVVSVVEPPLLLLVRFIDIVALGGEGIAWHSPRLAADDLRVGVVDAEGIHCTGDLLAGDPVSMVVDPSSGQVSAGPRLVVDPGDSQASRSRRPWRRR